MPLAASVLVFDQGLLGNKHMVIESMFSSRLLDRYHRKSRVRRTS